MDEKTGTAAQRPPYRTALGVVIGTLVLYVLTLAPTTQFWDTSEYIAAAKVLGIPHPPGNPLFTMMAHVWGFFPFMTAYAARINLFAAATSAVAAGCWFLVGERWLRDIIPLELPRRLCALAGAIVAATAFTVWNQSVVNEKVYTLSLLSIALILWLIVRWDDQPAGEAHDHHLLAIVYLLALTSTNHMMGVLVGPVVVVLLFPPLMTKRATTEAGQLAEWGQWAAFTAVFAVIVCTGLESFKMLFVGLGLFAAAFALTLYTRNWRFALVALGVAAVGLSVYIFLPIRAAHFPPINEGEPTHWDALRDVLTRAQYGKPFVTDRQSSLLAQLGMWGQYFGWQWAHDLRQSYQAALAVVFGVLGVLGAYRHWMANRRHAIAMLVLMGTFTLLLIFYLNFKYGFSWDPTKATCGPVPTGACLPREVRERDYFFLCSFALWGIWVAMGLASLMEWLQDGLRLREPSDQRRWAMASPVLLVALIPLFANRLTASRHGETLARDFAVDLLQSVEPYGVLVTAGDNDTFPLWYAQEVEHVRQDVTVLNLSLANTDWYLRQMQRRPVADFDPTTAPTMYRGRAWPKPSGPPIEATPEQVDAIPPVYPVQQKSMLHFGTIPIIVDPEYLGKDYLERADIVTLMVIRDQLGKRPIYFSRTTGYYPDQFGLSAYLEGQGFARKLVPAPIVANDSVVLTQEMGYVNVPRTTALLDDVYHHATTAHQRPRGWVDRPSEGILYTYGVMDQSLANTVQKKNPALAALLIARADSVFRNTSVGSTPGALR
ncbi:MAG TPA: DUF2723 domain-containing protein [Gemmatimonadales bacterium]|jgi:hypothetical protein|nr:DUF2723 domain-containing protein [Gemmatimonadales bacterium]